jgi:hypothetical protein
MATGCINSAFMFIVFFEKKSSGVKKIFFYKKYFNLN